MLDLGLAHRNVGRVARTSFFEVMFRGEIMSYFSALKLIVSDLRSNTSPAKVEKTIFLRLNKHLIPGLGKVLRDLDALTEERKSNKEAAVNAKNAAAGSTDVSPISVS